MAKLTLNDSQKKAVEFSSGALLVVAGAGTGKTRVIAQRIKSLINENENDPQSILALTFTEKASSEMLGRVDDVMPLGYVEPWIYTFHSFADRVLRAEALEIGLDPSFNVMSSSEQWVLLRKHLFDLNLDYFRPLGNPTKFISAILSFISRLQDENILPYELKKYSENFEGEVEEKQRYQELAHIYETYTQIKLDSSKMDFGDLITWTIKLFEDRPLVLNKYKEQFKHIMVDEFQDTNHAQYELVKKLFPPKELKERSLLVVGDDSQSIYKFRGAAVSNILEFREDYPDSEMVSLIKNYRSTQDILDASYKLIKHNDPDTLEAKLNISKELISQTDRSKKNSKNASKISPEIIRLDTLDSEVEFVLTKIIEILSREASYTYKDFAILARANNHLDPFVLAMRKYGLPYQLVGNRGLYDCDEVRDVISLIKILADSSDAISLYRVLNIDSLDIPSGSISAILTDSRKRKIDLWTSVQEKVSSFTGNNEELKFLYETVISFQEKITKLTPVDLVYQLVSHINYLSTYTKEETISNQLSIKNLDLFLDKVKNFEVAFRSDYKEIPTIVDFIDYLDQMIDAGDNPAQAEIQDIDTINLLTVHASKGLEFPVVFMVNIVGNRFPTRNRKDPIQIPDDLVKETLPIGDAHIQEERRLFYVGMTRAEKYLYMTLGKNYGGKRDTTPSGYLSETGLEIKDLSKEDFKKDNKQVGLFGIESGFREPKAEKITNFVPRFLSYSQISMYETCPLQYKYSYILNIPRPPSHALSFGITIHDTLKDFHMAQMFDKTPDLSDFHKIYEKNWQPLGYLDEEHRNLRFESGKDLLKKYYDKHSQDKVKPLALEKSFNLWIGGIKFFGRIDRIDPLPDGGVEIIDYKTGTEKDQKYVDRDDQVAFYALGVKEALKMEPKKMSLYFVEAGEKISTTRTPEQLEKQKQKVIEVIEKIKSGDFEATPGMHCKWCDYQNICPFAWKG